MAKSLPAMQETWVWSLDQEDPLEQGMATYFSILDWEIPQRSLAGYSPWGCKELDMNDGLTLSPRLGNTHQYPKIYCYFYYEQGKIEKWKRIIPFTRVSKNSSNIWECIVAILIMSWCSLFGTPCASCTWISVSFLRFGKCLVIISSNTFSISFSLSSPGSLLCINCHDIWYPIGLFYCFHFFPSFGFLSAGMIVWFPLFYLSNHLFILCLIHSAVHCIYLSFCIAK